jgi:hypothetical protein
LNHEGHEGHEENRSEMSWETKFGFSFFFVSFVSFVVNSWDAVS